MSLERDLPLTYFNPCLREGGDQYGDEYQCNPADFNPRLREGGDPDVYFLIPSCKFQSTPPRRRRLQTKNYMRFLVLFQSTPPRRRRRFSRLPVDHIFQFQSTPPRRRRPQHIVIPHLSCTYLVSTTFLSAIFSFISQYIVLFFLF